MSTKPARFLVGKDATEFHLHGGLVARLSAPLDALVNRTTVARMRDTDASVFMLFAQFVYSGNYALEPSAGKATNGTCSPRSALIQHAKLWSFAQTYRVEALQRVVSMQLARELDAWTAPPGSFIADFRALVYYVYGNSCSFELRHIVAQFAARIADGMSDEPGWESLLWDYPGFALDLLQAMALVPQ